MTILTQVAGERKHQEQLEGQVNHRAESTLHCHSLLLTLNTIRGDKLPWKFLVKKVKIKILAVKQARQ